MKKGVSKKGGRINEKPRKGMMSGLWKVLVVLGVVFAVGCGATTAQDSPSPIAPILAGEAVGPTLTADAYFQDKLDAAYAASAALQGEAVGPTLTADEPLDAYIQAADDRLDTAVQAVVDQQRRELIAIAAMEARIESLETQLTARTLITADERFDRLDAAVQAAGRELTADERLDAAFRQDLLPSRQELPAGATLETIPPPSLFQEGDAIKLVQFELRKSLNNCASLGPYRCSEDQVLKAFDAGRTMPSWRVHVISAIGKTLLKQEEWTAIYEPDSQRWRVEGGSYAFYVYETTRIVEGVVPSRN